MSVCGRVGDVCGRVYGHVCRDVCGRVYGHVCQGCVGVLSSMGGRGDGRI